MASREAKWRTATGTRLAVFCYSSFPPSNFDIKVLSLPLSLSLKAGDKELALGPSVEEKREARRPQVTWTSGCDSDVARHAKQIGCAVYSNDLEVGERRYFRHPLFPGARTSIWGRRSGQRKWTGKSRGHLTRDWRLPAATPSARSGIPLSPH